MASVQYTVLYKYVHPTSKNPITNTTAEKYDSTTRYVKAYAPGMVDIAEVSSQGNAENPKYDMLFMYYGAYAINSLIPGAVATTTGGQYQIMAEKFERCKGEAWFVASVHSSLKAAMKAADPIVKSIGKTNVKVVKNVPLDITVGLE